MRVLRSGDRPIRAGAFNDIPTCFNGHECCLIAGPHLEISRALPNCKDRPLDRAGRRTERWLVNRGGYEGLPRQAIAIFLASVIVFPIGHEDFAIPIPHRTHISVLTPASII